MSQDQNPPAENHPFQAEMEKLLSIIIHSLYSEREVFLRELVSNAADALSKARFAQLAGQTVRNPELPLEISLEVDAEAKILRVHDTGIGMTGQEMRTNLGTIAKSGTLEFITKLSQAGQQGRQELIGQFGVGFYAAFMAADTVEVESCPADPGEQAHLWRSNGKEGYSLAPSGRTRRGTTITLFLRQDALEFANSQRLEGIIRRYSNFIPHPIQLEGRRLNTLEAIWAKGASEVEAKDYTEFYRFITHGFDEPLNTFHISIDAPVQYKALLFVPQTLSNEVLYAREYSGLQLYANKVFIQNDCKELLPGWLRFMRGVVDSEDVPLNVSRQTAQNSPVLAKIQHSLVGRVLRELKNLAEKQPEDYEKFWKVYGKVLKEGLPLDPSNKEKLLELLRFESSTSGQEGRPQLAGLKDYLARMKPEQKEILYLSGPSREAIGLNPALEIFRKKEMEVLFLTDQVDGFVMNSLGEYEGKKFASIDAADLETLKEAGESHQDEGAATPLLDKLRAVLGSQVAGVVASRRLVESPAVLVNPEGISSHLQKMLQMMDTQFSPGAKVLEINPGHPLIQAMAALAGQNDTGLLDELCWQLLDNCLLVEGLIDRPEKMVDRVQRLMGQLAQQAAQNGQPAPKAKTAPHKDTLAKKPAKAKKEAPAS